MAVKKKIVNVTHPKLAQPFAIKIFQNDLDSVLLLSQKTDIKKSTIVRTAIKYAFQHGFTL